MAATGMFPKTAGKKGRNRFDPLVQINFQMKIR